MRRRQRHRQSEAKAGAERLVQRRADRGAVGVGNFDENARLVELAVTEELDLELFDRREATHDAFDGRRKHVDAAHDEHVIEPAEDAALEPRERAAAPTRRIVDRKSVV